MNTHKPNNIEEYISRFPEDFQKKLEQIQATIKNAVPDAEEAISYALPTFTLNGHYLVYFAGYKNHISLYPAPRENEAFKKELSVFKGGKGTVQFPLDAPMPLNVITKIAKFRVSETKKKTGSKKSKKPTQS